MKKAIYIRLIILTFVAILICSLVSAMIYAIYTQNQAKDWLTKLTLSTAQNYQHDSDVYSLSKAAGNNRITIIAPDGTVLADSQADAADMENHADREEVKYAKAGSVYIAMRTSSTLGQAFMYASITVGDGNILRLAYHYSGLFSNILVQIPAIIAAVLVALILSLILARGFARTVTNPLEKVVDALSVQEYTELASFQSPYYEVDKMMQSIQVLLQRISDSNQRLLDEQEKVSYILSNMAEGFVLIGSKKNILLCNHSAREFFSISSELNLENLYQLTRSQTIVSAIETALDIEQSSMFDLSVREGLILSVYVSPTVANDGEKGATVLLVNMTATRQLEQQKRDFFANASHELKTPITSVLGFTEMLSRGMVKSEAESTKIIARIETETRRLLELTNDILTISNLESGQYQTQYTVFDFAEVVKEAVDAISPVKNNTAIAINLDLASVNYRADRRQIYELCVNLIDNAVKYNQPNGRVDITLINEDGDVLLSVADTGIGIPPEYQTRVFERFFRVDYGRDKRVGGTGLGLSIVKHIVSAYGGKITLSSKKDEGTTITVSLPR